jgi:ABC-2 type transport system permease protein
MPFMPPVLLARKLRTFVNTLKGLRGWKLAKNLMFAGVGLVMLGSLYAGFWRLLSYLEGVQLIGPMLSWKLTSMVLLMTFSMVIVSSIIISMTTLYYSFDLKFLFSTPLDLRSIFIDKAFETVFYSSWTLVLAILPYIIALGRVKALGAGFYFAYAFLMVPFVMLAGAVGILFSMIVMYSFPSSRTRDITWLLGSLSVAFVYVAFRFSKPEQLLRPDSLQVVAQYIQYLQSPTAPYVPSWWVTKAMVAYSSGHWGAFAFSALVLAGAAFALYAGIYFLAGPLYMRGFSGAQSSPRFRGRRETLPEQRLAARWPALRLPLTLYWKDRLMLARDARYWSQIILIAALIAVYLFSIRQLPLDTPDLKSLVSFLNVGVAGFVVAAIGLRFTFPAISLEGNSYWLMKSLPVTTAAVMREKLLVSLVPSVVIGLVLIAVSNYLLNADRFVSILSACTIVTASVVISVMGIGLGATFPDFNVENIHQLESSYGGFLYMACSMGYLGLLVGVEAWPVQMHFAEHFGRANPWDMRAVALCAAVFFVLNLTALYVPWKIGLRSLERHEV